MSGASQPRPLVYPRLIVTDVASGNQFIYPLGAWSPGYDSWSKTDTVPRPRPRNVIDSSSMTVCGPHARSKEFRTPVTIVYPPAFGSQVTYEDIDPQMFVAPGYVADPPIADWQTALRLKVKDQRVNLAQSLAEFGQTQKMFVSNATAIANALRGLRNGNLPSVFKSLGVKPKQLRGTIANRWLELRYGWMPLIQDLHGAVEELQSSLQRPIFRKISLTVNADDRSNFTIYVDIPRRTPVVVKAEARVTAKVIAYCKQESLAACRLGLTNPLALAWELVPYSFVIDWIFPIGNWLNSLDAGVGLIEIYGTVSFRHKFYGEASFGGQYNTRESYARVPFYGLPDAPLPNYSPSIGVTRVANALALLSQVKSEVHQPRIRR